MLGLGLSKLVFTALVVAAVCYGFKWLGRMQEMRETQALKTANSRRKAASAGDVEDMIKCKICESYVAANGAVTCERSDCPREN